MGWEEWEQEPRNDHLSGGSARPLNPQTPEPAATLDESPPSSRRQRRRSLKAARGRRAASTRRAHLRDLEALPGLWVLIAAVLVAALVLVVRSQASQETSESLPTNGGNNASADEPGDVSEGVSQVTVDPHAGTQVLPSKGMPPGPADPSSLDRSTPQASALAFASQACAVRSGESDEEYVARLSSVATQQLAAAWQRGTAERIHCLQISGQVTTQTADTATATVSAVQVYDDGTSELMAYRWAAPVQLAVLDGVWTVVA